jgi:NitT/TauT family transport system permease protein
MFMPTAEPRDDSRPTQRYTDWLAVQRRSRIAVRGAQMGLLLVVLILWELLPRLHLVNPLFTSYPSALWPTFLELLKPSSQQAGLAAHAVATVAATVIGFAAAMLLGLTVAAALWWWPPLYRVLDPYLVVANAIPKTALVPLFYLWLGAVLSIYAMSLSISLFVTILIIYNGFQSIDPNKIKLAQVFGASKRQILAKVVLPGSVPSLIAALKVTAGMSLVGVVVGEFQSANLGLGYLIQYGSQTFKMNIVMTSILILVLVSTVMYLAISKLEAAVMRRR